MQLLGNNDRLQLHEIETWTGYELKRDFNTPTANFELSHFLFFVFFLFFYLTTWFPTSYGPPETSPQSTPDLAAAGVRSDPPLIPGEESRCCARCWSHGPTAASIRLKCRTGQPWRCAATSPVARLSAELTEQRAAHRKHTNQLLGKSFTCHPAGKKKKKKARLLPETLSQAYLPLGFLRRFPNISEQFAKKKIHWIQFVFLWDLLLCLFYGKQLRDYSNLKKTQVKSCKSYYIVYLTQLDMENKVAIND